MSSLCDLAACAPSADRTPTKFPIAPYTSAASYFDAYAEETFRAAKTIESATLERAAVILLEAYIGTPGFSRAAMVAHVDCRSYAVRPCKGVRTMTDLSPRVLSLSSNVELLTAISNDMGYENVFVLSASVSVATR